MPFKEEINKIIGESIYKCDGEHKECHKCLSNLGRTKDNKVVCMRSLKENKIIV